jgi:hypothetical protein
VVGKYGCCSNFWVDVCNEAKFLGGNLAELRDGSCKNSYQEQITEADRYVGKVHKKGNVVITLDTIQKDAVIIKDWSK